jgi:hypothetical protein
MPALQKLPLSSKAKSAFPSANAQLSGLSPKKNRCNAVLTKAAISDLACEAYYELRRRRTHAYGLDIFFKRGMLEWMLAIERPAAAYKCRYAETPKANRDELIAILTNMIEEGRHGV